ncbi:MAG: KEOPS complex subunit Pcc1 [Methanothermobacter sp.]|nr:KEOPS complex subunit Pcc1 [Methanothermobacter sp.]
MMIKAKIRLDYEDDETAWITFKALEPDNRGFIDGEIIGKSIIFRLESEYIGSIRQSIDDLLVSEMIIEKIW